MNFARKIVDSEKLRDIIDLPEELRKKKVEVIVLPLKAPIHKKKKNKIKKNLIDELIENPLRVENFIPLSREDIYER